MNLDILAPEYRLYINGKVRYRTLTGVILTMLWMLCLIGGSYDSFLSFSGTNSPISSGESYQKDKYTLIELKGSNLIPMIMIFKDYQTLAEVDDIPKHVTVYAERLGWEYSSDLSTGDISKHVRLNPVSCSQVINKTGSGYDYLRNNMTSFTEYVINSGGLCFDLDDIFTVAGNQMDYVYYTFTLHVKPCSLEDGCATTEELAPANFYVVTSQTHFQASDFEDPINTIPNYDFMYYINTAANQIYTSRIKENIVSDYRGLPPSWSKRKRFYDIKDTFLNLGMRNLPLSNAIPAKSKISLYVRAISSISCKAARRSPCLPGHTKP